tara:strand:+ start:692 stop:853 length:162 start_codon:yes stop_codon:yes gene_type:complete
MTRKHFKLIAQTIALITNPVARREAARDWCGTLRQTNPRFDSKRFLAACGVAV